MYATDNIIMTVTTSGSAGRRVALPVQGHEAAVVDVDLVVAVVVHPIVVYGSIDKATVEADAIAIPKTGSIGVTA